MEAQKERIIYLVNNYIKGSGTVEERLELWELVWQPAMEPFILEMIERELIAVDNDGSLVSVQLPSEKAELLVKEIVAKKHEVPVVSMKKRIGWRWMAVAAVMLAATITFYVAFFQKPEKSAIAQVSPAQDEITPGKNGAILTLANGKKIVLDELANGKVTEQAIKNDHQVSYKNASGAVVEYNTISTPNGRQYSLVLADGSKVWLNAASSLRFPTVFTGTHRMVELTGEGYFEVAYNAAMPFHIKVADMDVEVLGTHFNVMAYNNEELVKTTLLEGKVMVKKASAIALLLPGQQAQANSNGEIKVQKNADVDAAIAWKNGLFQLNGADVKTIGRQIERWYDVKVSYSGKVQSAHLSGEVPRTLNLSQVIKVLEESGIDVQVSGRNLLVTPQP